MNWSACQRLFALFGILFATVQVVAETNSGNSAALVLTNISPTPSNLAQLLALPPEQLEKVDIARIDLLCAEGLPSSVDLDDEKCLKMLDAWTSEVKTETELNYHRFVEHPEKFRSSLGRYRMSVMEAVLNRELMVQYNPQRAKELTDNLYFNQAQPYTDAERSFTSDSSDFFLHGLLSDKRFGTCSSMPFLYVAIGRRLGYPVSIASAHMHFYVYYDEGEGKHFNVEATETRGLFTPTDGEYKHPPWGAPSDAEYYESRGLLRPLSNQVSLGHLLAQRAAILRAHGRHDEEAKTWGMAARYFPDTPTWNGIEKNMQQAAKFDDYQQWREKVWQDLSVKTIPKGPGFAFFLDMKVKLFLFMNENFDRQAVEKVVNEYKRALDEYSKVAMNLPAPPPNSDQVPPLSFQYHHPDGNIVSVPADYLPPFPNGVLPPDLQLRITDAKPQDGDALLEIVWNYYTEKEQIKQLKQQMDVARITSGNPVLISEESIPPEFRQSVPPQLALRINGMQNAKDIVAELWEYKLEMAARQKEAAEMSGANPMAAVGAMLRQAGVPDSVLHNSGLPISDSPEMLGTDPLGGIPALQRGMAPNFNGLGAAGSFEQQVRRGNEQAMQFAEQYMKQQRNDVTPGFRLPYQTVPAAVAAGNPAVENPMPLGQIPNSSLTPSLQSPITAPTIRNKAP